MNAGDWIDGYQAQAQAPVDFIRGDRHRYIDGNTVKGSWSDPWWLYCPGKGWAIARRWKSKEQKVYAYDDSEHPWKMTDYPARDEIIVTPYEGNE